MRICNRIPSRRAWRRAAVAVPAAAVAFATAAGMAPRASSGLTLVSNPGSVTLTVTGARFSVDTTSLSGSLQGTASGTVTADGALTIPRDEFEFPVIKRLLVDQMDLDIAPDTLVTVTIITPASDARGTVNPGAGTMTLSLTGNLSVHIEDPSDQVFGFQDADCAVTGIAFTGSYAFTGTYSNQSGKARLETRGFNLPEFSSTGGAFDVDGAIGCAILDGVFGLPTTETYAALDLTSSPVLKGAVVYYEGESTGGASNDASSGAEAIPAGTTDVVGKFKSATDPDNYRYALPAGKTLQLVQSVVRETRVNCDTTTDRYSAPVVAGVIKDLSSGAVLASSTSVTKRIDGSMTDNIDCDQDGVGDPTGWTKYSITTTLQYRNSGSSTRNVNPVISYVKGGGSTYSLRMSVF